MYVCVSPHFRAGWVDCWSVPNFLLIIDYTWHPIYPQKADEQLKQSCKLAASVLCCYHLLEMRVIKFLMMLISLAGFSKESLNRCYYQNIAFVCHSAQCIY